MAISLDDLNVDGLVLFNRFYQPDIDLEKMEVTPNFTLSTPADMRLPLHWIGILYGKLRASLAATSGIYQAQDVIKLVMAGADVTMLCSALMRHGIPHIQRIEMELVAWLEQHQRKSLAEIKGIMSQQNCPDPSAFERAQYCTATWSRSKWSGAHRSMWRRMRRLMAVPTACRVGSIQLRLRPARCSRLIQPSADSRTQ